MVFSKTNDALPIMILLAKHNANKISEQLFDDEDNISSDIYIKNIDLARKDISNKLMIFWVTEKMAKFRYSVEKGHVWNIP